VSPGPASAPPSAGRGPRNAVVAVALLVLVLVVVLAGLLRGGPDGSSGASSGDVGTGPANPSASTSGPSRSASPGRTASPTTGARDPETGLRLVALASLPREAQTTVRLVDAGGPFPYAKDGVTFSNREGRLPREPRGWYREYTVVTPGEGDRGARRIVTGDDDRLLFYTADHYDSFVQVAR
jgi:ribonuclease T1